MLSMFILTKLWQQSVYVHLSFFLATLTGTRAASLRRISWCYIIILEGSRTVYYKAIAILTFAIDEPN